MIHKVHFLSFLNHNYISNISKNRRKEPIDNDSLSTFPCHREYNMAHFLSPSAKNKNVPTKKSSYKKFLYFLIFQEIELSGSYIKKALIFSQKKTFLIFRITETLKPYILGSNFSSSKNKKNTLKKFLTFPKMELSSPKAKNGLYFRRELANPD